MSDIENALAKPATSAELAAAITKAEAEQARLEAESTTARTEALDPLASAAQAAKCRARSEDLRFEADRMAAKLDLLRKRHVNAVAAEKAAAQNAEYDAAVAERDALAKELADTYPGIVDTLVDLLARISASNARLKTINATGLGAGRQWLTPAEPHARGVPPNFRDHAGIIPNLVEMVRLPEFGASRHLAWPRRDTGPYVPISRLAGAATAPRNGGEAAADDGIAWIGSKRETA